MPVWGMLGLALIAHYVLGIRGPVRQFYYVGSNPSGGKALGDRRGAGAGRWAFTAMGMIAGLAGLAFAARFGTAVSHGGRRRRAAVITAVILGGASLTGGKGSILGGSDRRRVHGAGQQCV